MHEHMQVYNYSHVLFIKRLWMIFLQFRLFIDRNLMLSRLKIWQIGHTVVYAYNSSTLEHEAEKKSAIQVQLGLHS